MISLPSSFPRRVRIHGGGFDASARAMHRNAAIENASVATIERTTMSTKTTIKRVALVAVAAMGFGLLSVAPSSAAVHLFQADSLTLSSATSTGTVGTAVTAVTLTQSFLAGAAAESISVKASFVSTPTGATLAELPTFTAGTGTNANPLVATNAFSVGNIANSAFTSGAATATFTPTKAGTYVIKFTPTDVNDAAQPLNSTAQTWTVTVAAIATADSTTTSYKNAGSTLPTSTTDATAIVTPGGTAGVQAAVILVVPMAASASVASTTTLSATISGPGTLGIGSSLTQASTGRAITAGATATTDKYITVWTDGTTGVATVTISAGAVVLATETITFSAALASYKITKVKTVIGVGSTDLPTISGLDAAGVAATLGTYYVTSATTAVATVPAGAQTAGTITVNGLAVGTSVITVANAATAPTITATFTVTVGKATIGTLSMSTDKTSYAAGEKVTLTVSGKGSDGTAVGDAALAAFSATGVTSNIAVQGTLPVTSVTFAGGVATYVIYAPATAGTVTLTGTEGTATDSTTKGTVTVSFDVSNPSSDAATDAANAATDAANYAADAADAATTAAQEATAAAVAAQESADAATAAVVALGLRVDTLLASVRAQLTSIANLIKRILAKK
ncbi:MAG: hypothetical protein Q8K86_07850 [Candidatus Nanopelagicaceae bacterium]|nr:hypothetical protein [Candidatus Nanopelagicaceae bacterium]